MQLTDLIATFPETFPAQFRDVLGISGENKCFDTVLMGRKTSEEVAPRFWLEFVNDRLSQDPQNSFWWSPRSIVVDSLTDGVQQRSIVGMVGFKSPPDSNGTVEIGDGIVPSQL